VGDHVAFLVEVDGGNVLEELGALLSFSEVKDLEAGHEA
jgi:hypothetical protein